MLFTLCLHVLCLALLLHLIFLIISPAGYYLATLEAATQHIFDLAEQYEKSSADAPLLDANGEDVLDSFDEKILH